MASDRLVRVNELLKRELARTVERGEMPELSGMLVSVTQVSCSPDLRNATVRVSVFGGDGNKALRALQHYRLELQRILAKNLAFKHTPVLMFKLDDRMAEGDRVLEILNQEEAGAWQDDNGNA
ncbi:MAG: 30S ribosome-binding factor RbfA [Lentisphaeria bacterium]|nr:30S ribosome-binding factor RbfA [Lentisphaeria bacterium]